MQYKEEGAAIRQKILLVNIFSGEQERLHQLKGTFFFRAAGARKSKKEIILIQVTSCLSRALESHILIISVSEIYILDIILKDFYYQHSRDQYVKIYNRKIINIYFYY